MEERERKEAHAESERAEETLLRLGTDPSGGLSEAQARENRERYGENLFSRGKKETVWRRLGKSLLEPMVIMLLAAGLLTIGVNVVRGVSGGEADYLECAGIFGAILLSVCITVFMEGRSAKAFEALSRATEDVRVKAVRDGEIKWIAKHEVAVGDLLHFATGDKIPADCRLVSSNGLQCDESALTGESLPSEKDADKVLPENTPVAERVNMLYSGCFVTGGSGEAVVTQVGDRTEFGKIARALSSQGNSRTPLQEKLAKMGKRIAVLGVGAALLVFVIQLFLLIGRGGATFDGIAELFISSIVLIVAAVPEGLPTIVAASLAINVVKMSKQNALVKKMAACETVGCVNVICSDKTGTLTENRMTVREIFTRAGEVAPEALADETLLAHFCLNGTADVRFEGETATFVGNPTECALLVAAHKAGRDYRKMREGVRTAYVYSFSSETKNMTTVLEAEKGFLVLSKGSPEKILALCDLKPAARAEAEEKIASCQARARRVIAFAHKRIKKAPDFETDRQAVESDLEWDGFVAIADPLRKEVYDAVARAKGAGIELKMLTGDNLITARAIAEELGILDAGAEAVEARAIEEMSEEELKKRLPAIRVIARSTPVVKMRVVNALKACGNVVAVTGDGINDAPALKNADVGIAMGISGTEVSKQASDVVLLDDSFATIVKSVQWGRGIYENFQRFIQFQLTVNLASVLAVLISVLAGFGAPFTALQLLWINIIMDGPPALTLGLEPVRGDLMNRPPVRRDASIVTKDMLVRILTSGLFVVAVFMIQRFTGFLGGREDQQATILFTLFVLFQLFNVFNSRELGDGSVFPHFFANRWVFGAVLLTLGLQVVITQFGGSFFGTVPLDFTLWLEIVGVALGIVILSEAVKFVQRLVSRKKRASGKVG